MKQTAVEWLYEVFYGTETFNQKEVLEQAKEMEKEQIMNAWYNSLTKGEFNSALEYYNETFKSKI